MNDKIQLKRGTLANWLNADPVLADGEMALVATDASKPNVYDSQKVGDGIHKFSELEMLGYKCLQELGDSQKFPMSQKATIELVRGIMSGMSASEYIAIRVPDFATGVTETGGNRLVKILEKFNTWLNAVDFSKGAYTGHCIVGLDGCNGDVYNYAVSREGKRGIQVVVGSFRAKSNETLDIFNGYAILYRAYDSGTFGGWNEYAPKIAGTLGDSENLATSQKLVTTKLTDLRQEMQTSLYELEKEIGDRTVVEGNVTNLPDEEDITSTKNENGMDVLSLKNRTYNPLSFSGKGYRVLRKNIYPVSVAVVEIVVSSAPTVDGYIGFTINGIETRVDVATTDNTTELVAKKIGTKLTETMGEYSVLQSSSTVKLTRRFGSTVGKSSFSPNSTGVACNITDSTKEEAHNVLTPAMISAANTIYEIRYDFDLNGAIIEVPDNCTLKFIGGKLGNGTLKGTYSNIEADNVGIFEETLSLAGNFNGKGVLEYYEEKGFWDTAFKNILLTFAYVELASTKTYTFSGNIIDTRAKKKRFRIEGNHAKVLNLTFLYNINKNGTDVAETSAIGAQFPSISNINFSRNDGKALPAIISGSALSIENCTFGGFTYCIAFLPIYIDAFVIDTGEMWACDYLLTSMNANGELTDSYFIGDWFSTKNFAFGGKGFTSFPITRGDFLFENCLHVILSLGYSGDYIPPSFSATFIRCHFELKSPMITYKKTDWNVGGRITFIGCWFYSSSLSDYPYQYHINSTINVGNSSNTNKVDLGTLRGTYCIQYKSAAFILNDSSLVKRDTANLLPIQALNYINMDARELYYVGENIFHAGDTVKIGVGYSSSPKTLILNNHTSQLFQKDFTCPKDGLITVTIWPKSRSFYLHCFYTFEGKTYHSVVPVSNYACSGKVNNSTFDIRFSKDKCLGSFFHEYSGELRYEVDSSGVIKGGTNNRPTLTSDNDGYEYYDTDLRKKILWNGTAWVNLDGTALA